MPDSGQSTNPTLALSTKVEEDFVAPLTAARGALEILRDFPELEATEQQRFVSTALRSCAQLERAIEELATVVYAAGQHDTVQDADEELASSQGQYDNRITVLEDDETIEIDFSDFEFTSSQIVNEFYDAIDQTVEHSGRDWYFMVNFRNCSVWPEAWVAFAHRGKKVNVNYSLGTIRYAENENTDQSTGADMFASRQAALSAIAEMKT